MARTESEIWHIGYEKTPLLNVSAKFISDIEADFFIDFCLSFFFKKTILFVKNWLLICYIVYVFILAGTS